MKHNPALICIAMVMTSALAASGASLLQPASFPKTFDDVPLIDRMAVLAEDYDLYDSEYDENGVCIKNCAYQGITLEDETAISERNNARDRERMELLRQLYPDQFDDTPPKKDDKNDDNGGNTNPDKPDNNRDTNPDNRNTPPQQYTPPKLDPYTPPTPPGVRTCATYTDKIVPRDVVNQAPLTYPYKITSKYGPRKRFRTSNGNWSSSWHKGVDMSAPKGEPVYAAANGTVTTVTNQPNGCGLYISIKHANGYATTYCHLSKQLVKVGDVVQAGCLIGQVGSTGNSTGPHLHYIVKINGEHVDPEQHLPPAPRK